MKWNDKRRPPTERNLNSTIHLLSDVVEFNIGNKQDSVDEVIASMCLESSEGLEMAAPAKSASEDLEILPPAKSANDIEIENKKPSPPICKGHVGPPPKSANNVVVGINDNTSQIDDKQPTARPGKRSVQSSLGNADNNNPFIMKKVAFLTDSPVVLNLRATLKEKFLDAGIRYEVDPVRGQ